MTIELRNLQIQDRQSEETTAFTASLYVDGRRIGYAKNSGRGGMTDYGVDNYHDERLKEILKKAEAYCESLEPNRFVHDGVKYENPSSLETVIDNIVDAAWQEKEDKRFKKLMLTHQKDCIIIGVPNTGEYGRIKLGDRKYPHTVASLLGHETGRIALKNTIAKIKKGLKPTERILNTNIPEDLL